MQVKALIADEFLDLVGDPETVPHEVLRVLSGHIPNSSARLQFLDLNRGLMHEWRLPELDRSERFLRRSERAELDAHPVYSHYKENHVFDPVRLSDLVEGDLPDSVPTGATDQMAARLEAPYGTTSLIVLTRDDGLFTDEERDILRMVRKTIDHVVRQARFGIRHEATINALAGQNWDGVVVDDTGYVTSTYLGKLEGAEEGTLLPPDLLETFLEWESSARPRPLVCAGGAEGSVRITEIADNENLLMYRAPDVGKHTLLRKLGLTNRQADAAIALMRGGTNYQIARQLGISESTVKKHLERVYAVLHVDNRAAASSAITELNTTYAP